MLFGLLIAKGKIVVQQDYYESSMSKTSRMGPCILLNDITMNYQRPSKKNLKVLTH